MSAFKGDFQVIGPNPKGTRGESLQVNVNPSGTKIAYGSGKAVVVRDVVNPSICHVYNGHKGKVSCVKWNNAGTAIASADANGALHFLELKKTGLIEETKKMTALGGPILDISWFPQDNKMAIVGEAKPSGRCITLSGTEQGGMGESFKRVLSVGVRPVKSNITSATGGYDGSIRFYKGAAPKFTSSTDFTKAKKPIQCVRYSPDGKFFAACAGSDIKVFDGETGEEVKAFPTAHKGSIYSLSWNGDSTNLLSCGSDGTAKLWDAGAGKVITEFDCSTSKEKVMNFQIGCTFAGEQMITTALSGNINYLDKGSGKVANVLESHSGSVRDLGYGSNGLFALDDDGGVHAWSKDHVGRLLRGSDDKTIHSKPGICMLAANNLIYSAGRDNVLKISGPDGSLKAETDLKSTAKTFNAASNGTVVFATTKQLYLIQGDKIGAPVDAGVDIVCAAISPDGKEIAVGGDNKKVHLFSCDGTTITNMKKQLPDDPLTSPIRSIDMSNTLIAVGLQSKFVKLLERGSGAEKDKSMMCFNSSSINQLKFSPNGQLIATAGQEGASYVYRVEKPGERLSLTYIHLGGVQCVAWANDEQIYTAGSYDGTIKQFTVKL